MLCYRSRCPFIWCQPLDPEHNYPFKGRGTLELELSGEAALITGAAKGIGFAIAEQFAQEGCDVHLWDRSPSVASTAKLISEKYSVSAKWQRIDLGSESQVSQAVDQLLETAARPVTRVVHAAAIGSGYFGFPFTNLKPADWVKPLQVNMMGMVHLAHYLTPLLLQQNAGSFVFIGSVAGQIGSQTDPPYSATKAANLNYMQCMAKDLAKHHIRVNMVCPGMVKTELAESVWKSWSNQQADPNAVSFEDWAEEKIGSIIPLGSWQSPSDIANMVLFLSSNRAAQVTGQVVNVDGGYVMHW